MIVPVRPAVAVQTGRSAGALRAGPHWARRPPSTRWLTSLLRTELLWMQMFVVRGRLRRWWPHSLPDKAEGLQAQADR